MHEVPIGFLRCSGSVKFWYGSGSSDPYLWRPRILLFSSLTFKMPNNLIFFQIFFAFYFLKLHLHHSSQIKSHKKSPEISGFLTNFAWWWKDPDPDGSGRPKNLRILRIRFLIRNSGFLYFLRFTERRQEEDVLVGHATSYPWDHQWCERLQNLLQIYSWR